MSPHDPSHQSTEEQFVSSMELYANLMTEVKARMKAIRSISAPSSPLPSPLIREFSFLQLRMICETIALGCLVAHGDIRQTRTNKLIREYSAERIIRLMAALHPEFFPKPIIFESMPNGIYQFHEAKSNFLDQSDLKRLYIQSGDSLHRGTVRKLQSNYSLERYEPSEILQWTDRIYALLDQHQITLSDGRRIILCFMEKQNSGNVQVVAAETIESGSANI